MRKHASIHASILPVCGEGASTTMIAHNEQRSARRATHAWMFKRSDLRRSTHLSVRTSAATVTQVVMSTPVSVTVTRPPGLPLLVLLAP